jgi:hypothetical protein
MNKVTAAESAKAMYTSLKFDQEKEAKLDTPDLDTFLVALYTISDDLLKAHFPNKISKVGPKVIMSDSEIITLGLCSQWLKWPERKLLSYVKKHWGTYFPNLLSQSEYNRRFNALAERLSFLVPLIRNQMTGYYPSYEIMDCVPVPLMKRCRGEKAKLFSRKIANIGKGGSDKEWYYGVKLALAVQPQAMISGFIISPAKTSERWLAEYILCHRNNPLAKPVGLEDLPRSHGKKRVGPDGEIWPKEGIGNNHPGLYLTDRGYTGKWWDEHWDNDYKTRVLTPESYSGFEVEILRPLHSSSRQVIEDVNEHLSDDLGLNRIGARTPKGLLARVAAKLVAFNIGVWLNQFFNRSTFAISTLFNL